MQEDIFKTISDLKEILNDCETNTSEKPQLISILDHFQQNTLENITKLTLIHVDITLESINAIQPQITDKKIKNGINQLISSLYYIQKCLLLHKQIDVIKIEDKNIEPQSNKQKHNMIITDDKRQLMIKSINNDKATNKMHNLSTQMYNTTNITNVEEFQFFEKQSTGSIQKPIGEVHQVKDNNETPNVLQNGKQINIDAKQMITEVIYSLTEQKANNQVDEQIIKQCIQKLQKLI